MDTTSDFFEAWLKSQENLTENWVNSARKVQQAFWSGTRPTGGSDLSDLYSFWTASVFETLNKSNAQNVDAVKETLSKLFSSSNAFMKLYEVWLPLFNAIQEKGISADSWKELSDPAKYKEILDKIWGFDADATAEFNKQAIMWMNMWGKASGDFVNPWAEAVNRNLAAGPLLAEGHPEAFMNIFHNLFKAFDGTVGTVFHVPPVGKDREKIELILKGFDDLSVYMAKNTEYQHTIYVTGQKALEKVIQTVAKRIREGEGIKNYNDFFNLWIDVNERTYYELFQTEQFSRLQGELLDASLNVRSHFFKLMELYLYDYPIALRSEMDDLYKTVYELKKKVKTLEKELKKSSRREVKP